MRGADLSSSCPICHGETWSCPRCRNPGHPMFWYPLHGPGRRGASEETLLRRAQYGGRKGRRARLRLIGGKRQGTTDVDPGELQ